MSECNHRDRTGDSTILDRSGQANPICYRCAETNPEDNS